MLINNKNLIKTIKRVDLTNEQEANLNEISNIKNNLNNIKNTELENLNTAIQTLETLVGVDETVGDENRLPSGDANVIASINRINNSIGTEELPTTAKTLKGAIAETFQSVSNGKTLIASAITDKGVSTSNNDTFQTMANNIKSISTSQAQPSSDPYRENRILIWEDDFNGSSINNDGTYELSSKQAITNNQLSINTKRLYAKVPLQNHFIIGIQFDIK